MKFICDAERCIECNGCVTACKNENEVPWGVNRRRVVTINDGIVGAEKSISVACMYPGASAAVLADTVAAPIEQQVTGVENVLYMSSQCTNDGQYLLTVTFDPGVDLDMAQVLVQNRVNLALPGLPDVVRQTGVSVRKKSPSILLVINLFSPDNSASQLTLSNYATINLRDELAQIPGVGDLQMFGQQDYSMRVWLDPDRI
ncbi:MAG: hypothetical protein EBX32_07315, partial [Burkholderiaceae bacterium]|nr:hypothetical protein [Burkholderiaceae bacterium]